MRAVLLAAALACVAGSYGCSARSVEDGARWMYLSSSTIAAPPGSDPARIESLAREAILQRDPAKEPSLLESARKDAAVRMPIDQLRPFDPEAVRNVSLEVYPLRYGASSAENDLLPPSLPPGMDIAGRVRSELFLIPPGVAVKVASGGRVIEYDAQPVPRIAAVVRVAANARWRDMQAAHSQAALVRSLSDVLCKRLADDVAARVHPGKIAPDERTQASARAVELPDEIEAADPWEPPAAASRGR